MYFFNLKFQNKTALITGSGTGIGKAIATKFVENGASVIILGRRREPLDEASKELEQIISEKNSGASVKIFAGVDVADETAMNAMFDTLKNDNVNVDYIIKQRRSFRSCNMFSKFTTKRFQKYNRNSPYRYILGFSSSTKGNEGGRKDYHNFNILYRRKTA